MVRWPVTTTTRCAASGTPGHAGRSPSSPRSCTPTSSGAPGRLERTFRGHDDVAPWLDGLRRRWKSLTVSFDAAEDLGGGFVLARGQASGFDHSGDRTFEGTVELGRGVRRRPRRARSRLRRRAGRARLGRRAARRLATRRAGAEPPAPSARRASATASSARRDLAGVPRLLDLGQQRAELRAGPQAQGLGQRVAADERGGRRRRPAARAPRPARRRPSATCFGDRRAGVAPARGQAVGDRQEGHVGRAPARWRRGSGAPPGGRAARRGRGTRAAGGGASARRRARAGARWPAGGSAPRAPGRRRRGRGRGSRRRPPGSSTRVRGLAASCRSAAHRRPPPRSRPSASGSREQRAHAPVALRRRGSRPGSRSRSIDGLEDRERVPVDVEVVVDALLHAVQRVELGQDDRRQRRGRRAGAGPRPRRRRPTSARSSAKTRSAATPATRAAWARAASAVARLDGEAERRGQPRDAQRAQRVPVEGPGGDHPQAARREVGRAPVRVDERRRPASGSAIALTSGRAPRGPRPASRPGARRGRPASPSPVTRQAPCSSESAKDAPPVARATRRAAARGSPASARSRSASPPPPSSRSRTVPPTSHASSPASAARTASSGAAGLTPASRRGRGRAGPAAAARTRPRSRSCPSRRATSSASRRSPPRAPSRTTSSPRRTPPPSGPRSTVTLSMLTVPTSGQPAGRRRARRSCSSGRGASRRRSRSGPWPRTVSRSATKRRP